LINASRTLLVGDAAGLVDPFTGEGVRFAIQSGRLAAEAILSGHPGHYAASIDRQIGRNHRLGLILMYLFYSLPHPCFELGVRNPFVTRALVDMLAGRIGYGRVIMYLVGTLPLFLPETVAAASWSAEKAMDRVRKSFIQFGQ
jgi:flavin-dependent dehydrogenase